MQAPMQNFVTLGLTLLSACAPYAPELGDTPFRCAAQAPRCPTGYHCTEYGPDRAVCESANYVPPDGPPAALPFICHDDKAVEPNDTLDKAFVIPTRVGTAFPLAELAHCPAADLDYYAVTVDQAGLTLEATVKTTGGTGLAVSLLNSQGVPVTNGTAGPSGSTAMLANAATGVYYVRVSGPNEANYDLTIHQRP